MKHSTGKPAPSLILLSVASGLSPFGMAIVVPAMNSIALHHNAPFSKVQFVMSVYLFGLAIAQPVCGYLCDRIGRRPVMLCGFFVFFVASLLCAAAPTLDLLILGRFVQALGVSVGTVASRAILRDCYDRNRMAEAMSYVSAATGLAPIMAPVFGGGMQFGTNYSGIFLGTALMGLMVFIGMARSLVETLPTDIEPPRVGVWLRSYRQLLSSRVFIGNTLLFGFVQGGFFSFMAIGSALFATEFNIQSGKFGLLWGLMALNYVLGSAIAAKATPRIGTLAVIRISVGICVLGGALVWAGANYGELTIFKILFPLGLSMIAAGGITPGAMAGAVANHPTVAGTASGLSSAMGLVVGGSFSIIAGVMYTGDYQPIALLIFVAAIAVAASWKLATIPQSSPT